MGFTDQFHELFIKRFLHDHFLHTPVITVHYKDQALCVLQDKGDVSN